VSRDFCNFRKGDRRKELLGKGNKIFHILFSTFPQLPDDCTDKIFSYLSDEDLRMFMPVSLLVFSVLNTDINNVIITANISEISC
jgi:hypothetical protein